MTRASPTNLRTRRHPARSRRIHADDSMAGVDSATARGMTIRDSTGKRLVALFSFLVRSVPFVGEKSGHTLYPEH
jgi:hypothetical protein